MPESTKFILIVDDREQNRYISSRILRSAGYLVQDATDGHQALEKVLLGPALVMLDVRLPDILGYEVCRRIKENPQTRNIPVLLVSAAFTSTESRVQALEAGADAYLVQPLEPTVLIATVRALLRLHDAEAGSRVLAKQWQSTFDALSEGIAVLDSNWRIARCNRSLAHLLGKSYREIEQQAVETFLESAFQIIFRPSDSPFLAVDVQLGRRWLAVRIDPIPDQDTVSGGILIVTDITDRKSAEEALRATEKMAAMGRLANSIAHEINNPLEAVTNLLYLLATGTHDPETTEYIEMANLELERMSRITRQTLAFNRESSEAMDVRLSELMDGVVTLYSRQFNERGIRVVRSYESDVLVPGFPAELRQVFSNILRNAIEAIPSGGNVVVRLRFSVDWKDLSRKGARISIIDSGMGMAAEVKRNIFEPFYTTKELKGSGLGLWLTMGIISKHQGRISVRSTTRPERAGTCFSIFLPASRTDQPASMPAREQRTVA